MMATEIATRFASLLAILPAEGLRTFAQQRLCATYIATLFPHDQDLFSPFNSVPSRTVEITLLQESLTSDLESRLPWTMDVQEFSNVFGRTPLDSITAFNERIQ